MVIRSLLEAQRLVGWIKKSSKYEMTNIIMKWRWTSLIFKSESKVVFGSEVDDMLFLCQESLAFRFIESQISMMELFDKIVND